MQKLELLKLELRAMEKIAKIMSELPDNGSVYRISNWVSEVATSSDYQKYHEFLKASPEEFDQKD